MLLFFARILIMIQFGHGYR